ncbi:MAG TPA: hypothetical protein VM187_09960, partial [Niastella sp.]|nr:hypothetical protein [Niastella sp.]
MKKISAILLLQVCILAGRAQTTPKAVPDSVMHSVYEQVKTPYKYGLVIVPANNDKKLDCPTVFRKGNNWYMTYVIFDGRGYETWLSE